MSHLVARQRLVAAATDVVEPLLPDLSGSATALALTGRDSRLLCRWELEEVPTDDPLTSSVAPIHDPSSRLTVGAIELTARASEPGRFMGAYIREVARHIGRALTQQAPMPAPQSASTCAHDGYPTSVAGTSPQWQGVLRLLQAGARSDQPVAIEGEPGTGKLTLATAIHEIQATGGPLDVFDFGQASGAAGRWPVDAIPARLQQGGTVVLRRIDRLPPVSARRLVATIDDHGHRATRVIATYSHLLARPRGLVINVPPLRERREDVLALVTAIAARMGRSDQRWSSDALAAMKRYRWPDNVRELEDMVTSVLVCRPRGDILIQDLPDTVLIDTVPDHLTRVERVEATEIMSALREANGNKVRAAATLGISRSTLYRRLKCYGVAASDLVSVSV